MDADRFAALVRSLSTAPSRRDIGRALVGLALGGSLSVLAERVEAKNNKKKKKRCKFGQVKCPITPRKFACCDGEEEACTFAACGCCPNEAPACCEGSRGKRTCCRGNGDNVCCDGECCAEGEKCCTTGLGSSCIPNDQCCPRECASGAICCEDETCCDAGNCCREGTQCCPGGGCCNNEDTCCLRQSSGILFCCPPGARCMQTGIPCCSNC